MLPDPRHFSVKPKLLRFFLFGNQHFPLKDCWKSISSRYGEWHFVARPNKQCCVSVCKWRCETFLTSGSSVAPLLPFFNVFTRCFKVRSVSSRPCCSLTFPVFSGPPLGEAPACRVPPGMLEAWFLFWETRQRRSLGELMPLVESIYLIRQQVPHTQPVVPKLRLLNAPSDGAAAEVRTEKEHRACQGPHWGRNARSLRGNGLLSMMTGGKLRDPISLSASRPANERQTA